jgi:hypothetical protein
MSARLLQLPLALMLALVGTSGVAAQSLGSKAAGTASDQTILPVWNNASGKLEALLVLEPMGGAQAGTRLRFGNAALDTTFGLETGHSLGLLCDRKKGLGALGSLSNNCMLATLGDGLLDNGSHRASANAAITRGTGKVGLSLGSGHDTLPAWLTPGAAGGRVDVNDLTVFAQKNLSRQGYVSIAGTVAKARLISPSEAPALADRWSSRTLSIGGGFGAFGANIVGHVVDTPGQPKWEGLGLGLTWRTPWSGQLTVGADNVITRGKNPFTPASDGTEDEGTVPYVRYQQDL